MLRHACKAPGLLAAMQMSLRSVWCAGTRADFQCSGRAISMFLCSTTGRSRGAGMDDWEEVEVQLILRTYNSPEEVRVWRLHAQLTGCGALNRTLLQ